MDAVRRIPVRTQADVKSAKPEVLSGGQVHKFSRTNNITACGVAVPAGDARWVKLRDAEENAVTCSRCMKKMGRVPEASKPKPAPKSKPAGASKPASKPIAGGLSTAPVMTWKRTTWGKPAPKPEGGKRKRKQLGPGAQVEVPSPDDDDAITADQPDGTPVSPETPNTPDEVTATNRDTDIPF